MHTREGTHTTPGSPAKAQPPGDLEHVQRDVRIRSKTSKINVILSFSCRSSPLPRTKNQYTLCAGFSFCAREGGLEQGGGIYAASKATVRLCLACGSQPVGMSIRGVPILYRSLFVRGRGSRTRRRHLCRKQSAQCNNDDRSLRLKQGGVVGAAF